MLTILSEGCPDPAGRTTTPGRALWRRRHQLAALADRIRLLSRTVDRPGDLALYQWVQITALVLEWRPDLIIELGRGFGNSTCCFTEAAHQLQPCRVLSICLSDVWSTVTAPRLSKVVAPAWFEPLRIVQGNILDFDFAKAMSRAARCLVFWDAHGFEVAECVLGGLLPLLKDRHHVVLMHDMSDLRFCTPSPAYGEAGIWKGVHSVPAYFWLGHICASVGQAISIVDFATRNRLPLHSADESLHEEIGRHRGRLQELQHLLGDDLFSLEGHWFWFTLQEAPGPVTFPRVQRREKEKASAAGGPFKKWRQWLASLRGNSA